MMNLRKWYKKLRLFKGSSQSQASFEVPMKGPLSQSPYLQELLCLTDVSCDTTLESIVSATQKKWLRPHGQERWSLKETASPKEAEKIYSFMEKMGFCEEIPAKESFYDYAMILGATFTRVQNRLGFLIDLWKKGVRFRELVFLCGERPLDPDIEPESFFIEAKKPPKNETEMMLYVYEHWNMPAEMRNVPLKVVSVPFDTKNDKRPNTADTIRAWADLSSDPGKCLFVSNQPYCIYQAHVIKNYLPKKYPFEMVGASLHPQDENSGVLLDNLARCLYEELQITKKK